MRKHLIGSIYIVRAERHGLAAHWAAATLQENAIAAVERELGPEWTVSLTPRRLPSHQLSALKMRPNTVRKTVKSRLSFSLPFGLNRRREKPASNSHSEGPV